MTETRIKRVFDFITNRCNYRCPFCFVSSGKPVPDELSYNERLEVYKKLVKAGIEEYHFLGGEPTIHPPFYQMYKWVVNHFKEVYIQTNGSIDVTFLPYSDNVTVEFSLEEGDTKYEGEPNFDNWLRAEADYPNTIRNILKAKNAGFEVYIRSTIFQKNNIESLIKTAQQLGVGWIGVRFYRKGRGASEKMEELVPDRDRMEEVYELVEEYREKGSMDIMIEDPPFYAYDTYSMSNWKGIFKERGQICPAGKYRISIMANGDVYPCSRFFGMEEFKLGNLAEQGWESIEKGLEEYDKKLKELKRKGGKCNRCPHFSICKGGCKWYDFTEHGGKEAGVIGDPICPVRALKPAY